MVGAVRIGRNRLGSQRASEGRAGTLLARRCLPAGHRMPDVPAVGHLDGGRLKAHARFRTGSPADGCWRPDPAQARNCSSTQEEVPRLSTGRWKMTGKRVLGIVLAGGAGTRLAPLTADRAKSAVPFGGLYRLVDFTLSNLVNGGCRRICVLTQYKSHSLDRHITTTWRLSSMMGNYVTPVPAQQRLGPRWQTGSADAIYQSLNLIYDERPDIVAVFGADHVYRMDPMQMIDQHLAWGAGATIAAIPVPTDGGDGVRRGADRAGRPQHRGIPGEAGRPAGPPWPPGRGIRIHGHVRVRHQCAGRRAAEGRGRRWQPAQHGP